MTQDKFMNEIKEIGDRIKFKYHWDNVEIHYESNPEYCYIETGVGKCKMKENQSTRRTAEQE